MTSNKLDRYKKCVIMMVAAMIMVALLPGQSPGRPVRRARKLPIRKIAKPAVVAAGPRARSARAPRYVRQRRYWHRHYGAGHPKWAWTHLGYRYYLGGASYVATSSVAEATEDAAEQSQTSTSDSATSGQSETEQRYEQMQQLADMVHEWRSLNESPEVHGRLPLGQSETDVHPTVKSIGIENQQFDEVSRQAMRQLVEGLTAQTQISAAYGHLAKLTELVESLPEAKSAPTEPSVN